MAGRIRTSDLQSWAPDFEARDQRTLVLYPLSYSHGNRWRSVARYFVAIDSWDGMLVMRDYARKWYGTAVHRDLEIIPTFFHRVDPR